MDSFDKRDKNIYGFIPSAAACVIFIILFLVPTTVHIWQLYKAKCWYFIPFVIGGIFQIIGYVCRVISRSHVDSTPLYAMQTLFILLAPPLYSASIYMVLGRLMRYLHAEHHSLVRVSWVTKLFVSGDVFSFLLQAAGGGMMSSGQQTTGENVTIGGLVVQILFFGFFVVVSAIFHYRIHNQPTSKSQRERMQSKIQGWKQRSWFTVLLALYVVSCFILIRSVYRIIEYKDGFKGYIMTHEVYAYIFDATLMFLAMVVMNVYHPAEILGNGKVVDAHERTESGGFYEPPPLQM